MGTSVWTQSRLHTKQPDPNASQLYSRPAAVTEKVSEADAFIKSRALLIEHDRLLVFKAKLHPAYRKVVLTVEALRLFCVMSVFIFKGDSILLMLVRYNRLSSEEFWNLQNFAEANLSKANKIDVKITEV